MRPAPDSAPAGAVPDQAACASPDEVISDSKFASVVAAVSGAFGDPTRRDMFLFLRSHPGSTASDVASTFSLHPNVARHHLHRLVEGGYLRVTMGRREQGAGRPSQLFFPVDDDPVLGLMGRRDDLLVLLLREALSLLGEEQAERMAADVGEAYGRALADRMSPEEGQRSVRAAMHAIATTLTAHGFAAHAEDHGVTTTVVAEQCPFGDAATTPPVLCAVDRGMVKGLLAGLCGGTPDRSLPLVLSSRARGDDSCSALA